MICKICSQPAAPFANARILHKYEVQYFQCSHCGFTQTEAPYWLEEAYSEAITLSDIGLVGRNIELAKISAVVLPAFFNPTARFLDYGGGYGLFVRLMRDAGFDFYLWDKFVPNLFAKHFEADLTRLYEAVTAFEVFEHLVNPLKEVERILSFSKNILFTTLLIPPHNPKPDEWWYYGTEHGQHVALYTGRALALMAQKFHVHLYSNGTNLHLLTGRAIFPPTFRWLTRPKLVQLFGRLWKRDSLLADDYFKVTGKRLV